MTFLKTYPHDLNERKKVIMKAIFEQGEFRRFSQIRLDEAVSPVMEHYQYSESKTTVFISHKHDDLDDLKGLLGFLEKEYTVKVYIDSQDSSMPKVTSAKTAQNLKEKIKKCDKFIFLGTHGAINSKWCNWELGYGDAQKFEKNIALFSMKPKGTYDSNYDGSEYMSIYPYIVYHDGSERYTSGKSITKGYYVRTEKLDGKYIKPLDVWFNER